MISKELLNKAGGKMKLYVGNLPWSIDDAKLKDLFSSYGEIEDAILIRDKFSKRSKGFGFVTFAKEEDAKKAISEMHEKDVEGRPLTVSEAKPMVPRDNSSRRNNFQNESSEAPMANPSDINGQVKEEISPEITDEDSSNSETEKTDIETVEEAKEDAALDEPASEKAEEAEKTTESEDKN